MTPSTASAGVNGTPTRERLPFPQSINPSPGASHRNTTSSTSSSSITAASSPGSVNANQPASAASILKQNATAVDPKMAALEQAVNERNVLSGQNAQLWKLIEKQRAGYNQILKELERVRSERDSYKAKIGALAGGRNGGSERRKRSVDGEGNSRPNNSEGLVGGTSESQSSVGERNPSSDLRQGITRHNSDDQPNPRMHQHHQPLHSSRSHEPLSPRERDGSLHSNSNHFHSTTSLRSTTPPPPPASAPNLSTPSRTQKLLPTPLVVPPRSESLPVPSSATQEAASLSKPNHPHARSDPSNHGGGVYNAVPHIRPPQRKSSITKDISNFSPASPNNVNYGTPGQAPSSASQHTPSAQYHGGTPPQTAPAGFGLSFDSSTPTNAHSSSLPQAQIQYQNPPPQIVTSPTTPGPTPTQPPSVQNNGMLSTIMESRPHALSRDSRISLPDEAKQYIASMGESPVPSPKVDAFAARFGPQSSYARPVQAPNVPIQAALAPRAQRSIPDVGKNEFLDLDEDGPEDDEEDLVDGNTVTHGRDDDMDSPIQPPDMAPQLPAQTRKSKPRAAPEDFPLPPPNVHLQVQQILTQAQNHNPVEIQLMAMAESVHPQQSGLYQSSKDPSLESLNDKSSSHYASQSQVQTTPQHQDQFLFLALPLLSSDLPYTTITVSHSFVRPNDRGKEVLSFIVHVNPGNGKDEWKVEKMYSDVLGLDQRVRNSVGKGVGKRIANLPEGKLWKDHAPAKVDQRKTVLEHYLQTLINLPVRNNDDVIAFFTSDIVREAKQPVMQAGHKEGYLTKRGKNFGGWKTRYFVLQGPVLEYYDCRGGAHLGSITVTGAQIGRQQRSERTAATDEEKEYRHAFLIVEAKKGPGGNHPRHVLCAESDIDRDSWVEMLVRYFSGTYSEEPVSYGPNPNAGNTAAPQGASSPAQPRSSTSSADRRPVRGVSRDDISISKGAAVPISQLAPDSNNVKLFQTPVAVEFTRSSSPIKSIEPSPVDRQGSGTLFDGHNQNARRALERGQGQPSSLPDSSPLTSASPFPSDLSNGPLGQRANSELGHYPDLQDHRAGHNGRLTRQVSPERHRTPYHDRKSFHPTLNTVVSSPTTAAPTDRVPSPEKLDSNGKVKISGPLNGAPIPSGFKFGGKDAPSEAAVSASDRREKAKSRSFWGFGKGDKPSHPLVTFIPRAVFGVALEEALDVAQIANLPAIVFRSIQYLEAKKADQEEGIYRLSGSSAVIKSLKDRFNTEGDVDLLASDEYWDPHAIAGLLKSFLRELPASILTRELHLKFLAVIDFVDAQERIKELSQLIAALPLANYSLLRALTAHLILIVQNSDVNKMTMRNVGIVFSPTLGIPAGVFSLMLGEFNRVFNVDADNESGSSAGKDDGSSERGSGSSRRNSRQYSNAAADQLLGLSGRSLKAPAEETQSDGDDYSVLDESGTETTGDDFTVESSLESGTGSASVQQEHYPRPLTPDTPVSTRPTKAAHVAATRGLNVTVTGSDRGNRHSRLIPGGLPTSPRPPPSPSPSQPPAIPPSPVHTQTA